MNYFIYYCAECGEREGTVQVDYDAWVCSDCACKDCGAANPNSEESDYVYCEDCWLEVTEDAAKRITRFIRLAVVMVRRDAAVVLSVDSDNIYSFNDDE